MTQPNSFVELKITSTECIESLKIGYFVDISGSTASEISNGIILDIETRFVKELLKNNNQTAQYVAWDSNAHGISSLDDLMPNGGTEPQCIFSHVSSLEVVNDIDVAVIITDGQINSGSITAFGRAMLKYGTHFKCIIGVIVCDVHGDDKHKGHSNLQISMFLFLHLQ